MLNIAAIFLRFRNLRGNLGCPANACAFKVVAYMVLAKRGLIKDPRFAVFQKDCAPLPRLSAKTSQKFWWPVGQKIAKGMFPDLDKLLFANATDPKDKDRNYSAALHHLGLAFKNVWPMFKGIEDA